PADRRPRRAALRPALAAQPAAEARAAAERAVLAVPRDAHGERLPRRARCTLFRVAQGPGAAGLGVLARLRAGGAGARAAGQRAPAGDLLGTDGHLLVRPDRLLAP